DEVRITVIAAGFDRYEGEARGPGRGSGYSLELNDEDSLAGEEALDLGDEVRITVIAAGFDRFEGERRPESPLGLLEEERALAGDSGDGLDQGLDSGDDDFDVPEFLR
ncbi:MAG: hypothetical protein ACXWA9_09335, partial [Acidimicrobiia bacterium]